MLAAPSALSFVFIASGATNTISFPATEWDASTAGHSVFVGTDPNQLTRQLDAVGTPSTITLTSLDPQQYGMPDIEFDRILIRTKNIYHSGVWGAQVTGVGAGTISVSATWTTNEWAGRKLSLLAKGLVATEVPVEDYFVSANNTTGQMTVSPAPSASTIAVGDVVVMRSIPTVGSNATGNYVEDAKWVNSISGGTGLPDRYGALLRIISGKGRGRVYRIKQNTATRIYIYGSWVETPDSTSIFIVEEANWQTSTETRPFTNDDLTSLVVLPVELGNYRNQTILVACSTLDGGDNESLGELARVREIYLFGSAGAANSTNFPFFVLSPTTSPVAVNWSNGPTQKINASGVSGGTLTVSAPSGGSDGMEVKLLISPGGTAITFDAAYGIPAGSVDPTSGTYTTIVWKYEGPTLRVMSLATGV
jgi:hypothetical protein